jgi:hypothetical protein
MTYPVLTGPIKGTVTCADGTVVDVKPDTVFVESAERAWEVALLVGDRYAKEGHPAHEHGDKFIHEKRG